jgi:L-fuculose-phosphate aldolase
MEIEPIGVVRRIGEDTSRIELDAAHAEGLGGLAPGDRLDGLYWMHELPAQSRRAMRVHPRGDRSRPKKGVFGLRSPMRPNPVGVTVVELFEVQDGVLLVRGLDAHDGSPVIDIKAARRGAGAGPLLDMWGKVHETIISTLESELGRRPLELALREPLREAGRAAAKQPRADAGEIGRAILAIEKMWGIRGTIVQDSPDGFTREVTACPWSFFSPLSCEVFAWWMEGFVRGSNAAFDYLLDRSIPRGDGVCAWSVRRQGLPT